MPNYKAIDSAELDTNLLELANAVRLASGTSGPLTFPDGFVSTISTIKTQSIPINIVAYTSVDELLGSVAADNTIGVIPVADISSWVFDTVEPEEPAEGTLWFTLRLSSPAEFNPLSSNGIMLYPVAALQYTSGGWESVHSEVCINGIWTNIVSDIFLYNAGTFSDRCDHRASLTPSNATLTYETGYMKFGSIKSTSNELYEVFGPIPLNEFKRATIEVSNPVSYQTNGCIVVSETENVSIATSLAHAQVNLAKGASATVTLDLTVLDDTTPLYIGVGFNTLSEWTQNRIDMRLLSFKLEVDTDAG